MSSNALLDSILNQPESLAGVLRHQFGPGEAALNAAAAKLRSAQRVVFTGMGSSLFACIPAAASLTERGAAVDVIETSELLYYRISVLKSDTVLVLVSRSGDTVEIRKLLPLIQQTGAHMIGVTNHPESYLGQSVEQPVLAGSAPDRLVAIQSYTGTATVLLLLAAAAMDGGLEGCRKSTTSLVDNIAAVTKQSLDHPGWDAFFRQTPVVYVLGRGASLASVQAGALLFHEAARMPAVAMSIAQFRHGPVEVVDANFRALVFASQARTKALDMEFASDLARLGAKVGICAAGGVASPFEPIGEIIPVQVAAYRLAALRGLTGDQFRFTTLVTETESGFGS